MRKTPWIGVLVLSFGLAQAAPPERINYQGVLRNATDRPLSGSYNMVFRFYDAASGGNLLLTDTHTGVDAVTVSGGLFNALLGDGALAAGTYGTLGEVFGNESDVYLEVQVGGETLTPRIHMASAGYALNAARLDGRPAGGFIDTSAATQTKAGDLSLNDLTVNDNDIFFGAGSKIFSTPGNLQLRNDNNADDLFLLAGNSWHDGRIALYGGGKIELLSASGLFEFSSSTSGDPIATLSPDGDLSLEGGLSAGNVSFAALDGPLELYVDAATGDDSNDGLTAVTAKLTIQAAVNAVPVVLTGPATIHIADGTYHETVTVGGHSRSDGLYSITLAGNESAPHLVVLDGESTRDNAIWVFHDFLLVSGMSINNYAEALIVYEGTMRVENSILTGNDDAAVFVFLGEAEIDGTRIEGNATGLAAVQSRVSLFDCEITGNSQDGIELESSVLLLEQAPLVVSNNLGAGVRSSQSSHVEFYDDPQVTILDNAGGDMQASYQSTIRGYENGTTGGCTADAHSTCEP